ncbi:hypothetical protein DFJ58DRAFT_837193 [Suillus subalutaceus]|uniref:uncharacterized protein n=1 Tax=Suillus subalutaceus TaxID=48586 RepID=UPI001B88462C|nr:uncharacterized protein DFJ58DRAFT_837193 [Suillus subalutaceus]KAG1871217.1 hypothetical protein DFJ58DRAFT_837193 [Suillus subalutaceus]
MSESIFGSPSHLLTAEFAPESAQTGNGIRMPAPVHQPPPSFTDLQFGTIGKPPDLLSRISAPDPGQMSFRSPSPATFNHLPPPINRNPHVPANPDLIPPIKVLPTPSESNMLQMQAPANSAVNKVREALTPELVYPASFLVTPTAEQSNGGISSSSDPSGSPKPHSSTGFFPQPTQSSPSSMPSASLLPNSKTTGTNSSQVPDVAQPEPSQGQVAQDSLSALYVRLLEKSKALSVAPPTSLLGTPSPFAPPSNIPELAAGLHNETNAEELGAIVLRHPYPQSSFTSNGPLDQEMLPADDGNALALTSLQSSNMLTSQNTGIESFVEATKKFLSVAEGAVKQQLDTNQAFEAEHIDFDTCRKAFKEHMLVKEVEYNSWIQMLRKQREELRTREERLVLEDESKRTAMQEEIAETMKLLEEVKAEKTQWEAEKKCAERERTLAQNNAAPLQLSADIEPRVKKEDGMTEEEVKAVDDHNNSLVYQHKLTENLKKQIVWTRQSSDTLQHMKETRLQAAEAERRRVEEEAEKQRVQAEEAAKRADEEQKL